MDKRIAQITNKSVEQSGLPSDFKKALSEYIWNGFDAGATEIRLDFESNAVGFLTSFSISDNGTGIDIETIDDTFGQFLDSQKLDYPNKKDFVKGRKGKGRYAFSSFAYGCRWSTTYLHSDGRHLQYNIVINKGELQVFNILDKNISKGKQTGTVVSFIDLFGLTGDLLVTREFREYLASEFGWYLFLNKAYNFRILINGSILSYDNIVGATESYSYTIGNYTFEIDFIRWTQKIGDKYYFYFLSDEGKEVFRKYTSFNNKAIDYHHSVYISSSFFNDFHETPEESPVLEFSGKNQTHPLFRELSKELTAIVTAQEKEFIRDIQADRMLDDLEDANMLSFLDEVKFKEQRWQDLKNILKELYCAEPKLFHGLTVQQRKAFISLLNIVASTGNKPRILKMMENISDLDEVEHRRLATNLQ